MSSKRIKNGWAFYDWANSVYSLVIATAIFPIYFTSISPEVLSLAGYDFESAALYSYSLAAAFIVVAILSPILSGIADYSGNKKLFMQIFTYIGSASCLSLYFFDESNIFFGLTMSVLAGIGFWGSLVFYNAYLPEIAKLGEQDALSAKGFSLGYIGSSLLLIFNLVIITFPEKFGISDAAQATRISFLTVAIWWAGFAQITFKRLPTNINNRKPKESGYLWRGFRELKKVALHVNQDANLRKYLYSFFFFSTGVQTIILLAGLFGSNELGMESGKLIATILIIQFVGIAGAQLFSFLSQRFGNLQSLKISIAIWAFICILAFLLDKNDPLVEYKFYGVGALVGLVMGGIQAISRSTYSKLLPETDSHASFFSFYDVSEKIAIVFGTVIYGYLIQITGDMKASALSLSVFFVIGFFQILRIKKTKNVY